MSKFGLPDMPEQTEAGSVLPLSERLAAFSADRQRHVIDVAAADAAAAQHGFTSREREDLAIPIEPTHGRRRRATPAETTRHLAIRLVASQYDRFVAFADRHQLTYHDALIKLMDRVPE